MEYHQEVLPLMFNISGDTSTDSRYLAKGTVLDDPLNASVTGNHSHSDPYKDFYVTARTVTGLYCFPVLCLFGIVGNFIALIVLNQKEMRTSTNAYFSALAVSDTVKLINDALYFVTILLYEKSPKDGQKLYGHLYPYSHYIFNMSVCVSSWLVVSVATERYFLICHPVLAKTLCTRRRAIIVSSCMFIAMSFMAIPSALRYKTVHLFRNDTQEVVDDVELTDLWRNTDLVGTYTWIQNLLRSVIPLVILLFMNTCILRATRAHLRSFQRQGMRFAQAQLRITAMLVSVIVVFLVCITPDAFMSTFFGFGYHESNNNLVKGVREITDMLLAVNAAVNVIIYMCFNPQFRTSFVQVFCIGRGVPGICRTRTTQNHNGNRRLVTKYNTVVENGNNNTHPSDYNGTPHQTQTLTLPLRSVGLRNTYTSVTQLTDADLLPLQSTSL
ncbi:FMRFamide receptor-like [Lingula anatina]|uniref:FMRFamide receptor-like n=1 Tax=Lingula anatina TaxID=7574 RepID=A0A1S3IAT7_LINAN|nr:FMRFamide receptor-like [Lingula anatina]XP_013394971.1 FMRFamide receptor-like [Lingula anatina]XP_023931955.1 FMRFamide receptor-like [Lingula anatina]|eukprot:XP_013394970.1 FMRFamide receptor-like [Lingula anatina]